VARVLPIITAKVSAAAKRSSVRRRFMVGSGKAQRGSLRWQAL
jgi:hypothetical protein